MKLKKFIKLIDWLTKVRIFTSDDEETHAFEGYLMDIPWVYTDMKIGRPNGDTEEPVYIYTNDNNEPIMVINILEED